jgi:predicted AAA+ superfamily ATPase
MQCNCIIALFFLLRYVILRTIRRTTMLFERTLGSHLESINASFPIVLITGPRQVGKTTLFERYRQVE